MPVSMLGHVPSATIVVHRSAVGAGFAPGLRVGEDVDLCMRLHEAGWRLRSVPDVRVGHRHRTDLRGRLTQRAGYGTGAADMALRHPGRVLRCRRALVARLGQVIPMSRARRPIEGVGSTSRCLTRSPLTWTE